MTEQRRQCVIGAEGAALYLVQQVGPEIAAERIRWQIDGSVNALIRIEGAEATSRFAFALGDRVAGNLREPTNFHAMQAAPIDQARREAVGAADKAVAAIESAMGGAPSPARKLDWRSYAWGAVHALAALAFIALARS